MNINSANGFACSCECRECASANAWVSKRHEVRRMEHTHTVKVGFSICTNNIDIDAYMFISLAVLRAIFDRFFCVCVCVVVCLFQCHSLPVCACMYVYVCMLLCVPVYACEHDAHTWFRDSEVFSSVYNVRIVWNRRTHFGALGVVECLGRFFSQRICSCCFLSKPISYRNYVHIHTFILSFPFLARAKWFVSRSRHFRFRLLLLLLRLLNFTHILWCTQKHTCTAKQKIIIKIKKKRFTHIEIYVFLYRQSRAHTNKHT